MQSPKAHFITAHKDIAKGHADYVLSEAFMVASNHAMLEFVAEQKPAETLEEGSLNHQRLEGAKRVLEIFAELGAQPSLPPARQPRTLKYGV